MGVPQDPPPPLAPPGDKRNNGARKRDTAFDAEVPVWTQILHSATCRPHLCLFLVWNWEQGDLQLIRLKEGSCVERLLCCSRGSRRPDPGNDIAAASLSSLERQAASR